ncbi:MAG: hypothetical protein KF774_09610 [Planctomyces sp.]|nr:hypothetical protein [Planctomyces sp.]
MFRNCRQPLYVLALLGLSPLSGCGSKPDGPPRHELYGAVTAKGQPVQEGRIFFSPDGKKGNSGPGAVAIIKDGMYRTPKGHGVVGGPHIVDILGYDAVDTSSDDEASAVTVKQILPVDLPPIGGVYDFEL